MSTKYNEAEEADMTQWCNDRKVGEFQESHIKKY